MSHKVNVSILGKKFSIRTSDSPESVEAAAALVQQQIDELRELGATTGSDRLITLAALNLAGELLKKDEIHIDNMDGVISALDDVVSRAEGLAKVPLR